MEAMTGHTPKEKLQAAMADLGLIVAAEFVPFSKSRNAKPGKDGRAWRSLNWKVTLQLRTLAPRDDEGSVYKRRAILTTDYAAGEAHCPAYKARNLGYANSVDRQDTIAWECENGRAAAHGSALSLYGIGKTLQPDTADVVYSLVSDSDVLDYSTFEDWAENMGCNPDSREAEKTYRACLEIALKLRNGIGEAGLAKLRDACQDY